MSDPAPASIAGAGWLADPDLQTLLAALSENGEEARVAGGAVRNTLLGQPVSDIDLATTTLPAETRRRAEAARFRAIPTGEEHGTVTVLAGGRPIEVTTLRADVETDGRHARVLFGRDWKADAERRDFTINALYADADGAVTDHVGGLADLAEGRLRFIGDPEARIREDYLRIPRFFRFFAWYGRGRPDAEGLKACARLKEGLERLSAERVWAELKKLLSAPDPSRALLWMRQASVLTALLPEGGRWGIDSIHGLVEAERDCGWAPDPLLRLMAILPPDPARMEVLAARLHLSNVEAARLSLWAALEPVSANMKAAALRQRLYRSEPSSIVDRLKLDTAAARTSRRADEAARIETHLCDALAWERPRFPLAGQDLKALGVAEGPKLGALLKALEEEWVQSGFSLARDTLLERAASKLTD